MENTEVQSRATGHVESVFWVICIFRIGYKLSEAEFVSVFVSGDI